MTLFDPPDRLIDARVAEGQRIRDAAIAARDAALKAVDEHADPDWKDAAYAFLVAYLTDHDEMFVDDLWAAGLPHTTEDRALGAVFQRASRARLMVKTGRSRPSVRSHLTDKPVWRSLMRGERDEQSE